MLTGWLTCRGSTSGAGAADGTTLVDTGPNFYSAARDQHIRQRSVACITQTGSARRGERRLAKAGPSTAGAIEVSPAFGGQIGSAVAYEVWSPDGAHPDQIDRCIDLASSIACWRWQPVPVTMCVGGDVGDELLISGSNINDLWGTSIWTGTNATPALTNQAGADAFLRRYIAVTALASPGYLQSTSILVDPDTRPGSWNIQGIVAAAGASLDARLVMRDVRNGADITLDNGALSSNRNGYELLRSTFTLPSGCDQLAVRLQVQTSGSSGVFGAIQVWNAEQTAIALPLRVSTKDHVGPLFTRRGLYHREFIPRPWEGAQQHRRQIGRYVQLELLPGIGADPLWYYEKTPLPALTSEPVVSTDDDNQTWVEREWIAKAALLECYKLLAKRDERNDPGRWDRDIADAQADLIALQMEYGAEPLLVEDNIRPVYRATARL